MSAAETNRFDDNDDFQPRQSLSEQRHSMNNSVEQNNFDDHMSSSIIDNEDEQSQDLKYITKPKQFSQKPKIQNSKKLSKSMVITDNKSPSLQRNSSIKTLRPMAALPSIDRRAVQGILVRFFRNGDAYHPGVKVAINGLEIKSWEAFLNYLNRQPKLTLPSGGIQHVYSLNGQEIRSINKFQNRQSYVVTSGIFIKANYRHINDTFNDDSDVRIHQQNQFSNGNKRSTDLKSWYSSSSINGEQLYILPYSRLNMYEIMLLNRNLIKKFDQWLNEEVTDLLSHYIDNDIITHLYAITKFSFIEIKSFSHLFNTLRITDRFIGCTDAEFQHSKHYLSTIRPSDFFTNSLWPKKSINEFQKSIPKQDVKLFISWIHGYDGTKETTKTLYTLSENEILYVINSICIIYEPNSKQQRFYTKHNNPITCVTIHRYNSLVASSETILSKDRSYVSIHIWDYMKLETIVELRKEQFGTDISLLSFSPKSDDNFLLIVSRDKPKTILFIDWKRNEIIYSINTKSDKILSALFVFNTNEWIACISQQYLLFYRINWNSKPLKITIQREAEVQNIYTGAVASYNNGEKLIVGDKVGSVHVWCLINNEPKLVVIEESILENDVHIIVCINQEVVLLADDQNQMILWNVKLNTIKHISLKDTFGLIQSICSIRRGFVIGTKLNYILLKEFDTEQINVIMRGHTSPSICICSNKNTDYFFSISSDRYLFKWNNQTRSVEWSIKSPQLISCATLHPQRNIIALGTETSKLLIYDTLSSYYITTIILKINTGVKAVRFSPNGEDLAVGLQNGRICIFNVLGNGDFNLRTDGIFQNNNNTPIIDIIWSVDSNYLLAIYSDNNYNIWSIQSFDIVREQSLHNISWYQMTHPISCSTIDKSFIEMHTSAIVLSPNLVLCSGKDGQIRVFQNFQKRIIRTLDIGLDSIQNMIPSTSNNTYLLTINNNPAIIEIQLNI
ncbi:unnamed protein product [Rotaria sordida]|uniref:Doublecortin domain-containing protein n=2 Tax=Rotaria sordida TaxID=392033 RepID=A0A813X917_9BILA|nr:unnamed protein product [Rotaria sordida]